VVWEGRGRKTAPYPDALTALMHCGAPGDFRTNEALPMGHRAGPRCAVRYSLSKWSRELRFHSALIPDDLAMHLHIRFALGFLLLAFTGSAIAEELPLLVKDDFSEGADRWSPKDSKQWKVKEAEGKHVYSLFDKAGSYQPPHRSPVNIALLKDVAVGDFDLTVRLLSTHPDYGHRDVVLVFGYQDPAHFYYVHLAPEADDHANQIFIVNDAPRKKISLTTTEGTKWDDQWHTIRVSRSTKEGTIQVFFDDLDKPVMTAKDDTFTWGQVGIGSFDDTADFEVVEVRGEKVEKK
jgi:hypothetical protein